MADVFSDDWLAQWAELINSDEGLPGRAPPGLWRIYLRVEGDSASPYVPQDESLHLLLHLQDGRCTRLEKGEGPPGPRDLDFRFSGPATVFEQVAAGLRDPVDAGLEGDIKIAGDMAFLLRHAEMVKEIVDLYVGRLETDWPRGKPPYGGEAVTQA
jgi:SCP-2 sterol transfer family